MDPVTLALAKAYTDQLALGGGSLRGAPASVRSIDPVEGGNEVTFGWTLSDGSTQTSTMMVKDGVDGLDGTGIQKIEQTVVATGSGEANVITITLTDGTQSTIEVLNGKDGTGGAGGSGLPVGGEPGQVLAKASAEDHDVHWITVPGGEGGGAGNVWSDEIATIRVLDRLEYDAIQEKDPTTMYLIKG